MIGDTFDPTSIVISETYVQAFLQCGIQITKTGSDKMVKMSYPVRIIDFMIYRAGQWNI